MSANTAAILDDFERPLAATTVVRNAIWLYSAEILVRVLFAALLVIVARELGPDETGKYVFVASIAAILGSVSDFGSTQYFIRSAVNADPVTRSSLFWLVMAFRMALTGCLVVVMVVYAASTRDLETRWLLELAAIALPVSAAPGVVAAALRAQQRMAFEAVAKVIVASITLLVGGALVAVRLGVTSLGVAGILAAIVSAVYYGAVARRQVRVRKPPRLGASQIRAVAVGAWPFFSMTILVVIYSRLDTVLLQQLMGARAVGQYGVAVRVMEVLFVIPAVLGAAIFPSIAQRLAARPRHVVGQAMRAMRLMLALGIVIGLVGSFLGPSLFAPVFGSAFGPSGAAFRILVWTTVPVFASVLTSSIIAAGRTPIVNTYLAAMMVAICVVGNVILIPRYGINGAAAVRLVTETSGLLGGFLFIAMTTPRRGVAV